jgi:hypothetical protein
MGLKRSKTYFGKIVPEISWLAGIAIVCIFISILLNVTYASKIYLYNIHFIKYADNEFYEYFPQVFSIVAFLVYAVRGAILKYNQVLTNVILLFFGFGVFVTQTYIVLAALIYFQFQNDNPPAADWVTQTESCIVEGRTEEIFTPNSEYEKIYTIVQYTFLPLVIVLMIVAAFKTWQLLSKNNNTSAL